MSARSAIITGLLIHACIAAAFWLTGYRTLPPLWHYLCVLPCVVISWLIGTNLGKRLYLRLSEFYWNREEKRTIAAPRSVQERLRLIGRQLIEVANEMDFPKVAGPSSTPAAHIRLTFDPDIPAHVESEVRSIVADTVAALPSPSGPAAGAALPPAREVMEAHG